MSHHQYQNNPYSQGPNSEAGYGYGAGAGGGGGYRQNDHELQQYPQGQYTQPGPYDQDQYDQQPQAAPVGASVLSQQDFLARIQHARNDIRSLTADIQSIATLHQRALTGNDPSAQNQLEALISQSQLTNTRIRDQIRSLKSDAERTTDGTRTLKIKQFDSLNDAFKEELKRYLAEEQQYKERYREQIARQYRIVNPEASDQEVRAAADQDWGNEGVFQQALRTNRSGQASAVLGAVRARHNELLRIEQSIVELAQLFQDLDTLVVQQDAPIQRAEEQTEQTVTNLQEGNKQVEIATDHARRARKLKWWAVGLTLLILVIIAAAIVGWYFTAGPGGQRAAAAAAPK